MLLMDYVLKNLATQNDENIKESYFFAFDEKTNWNKALTNKKNTSLMDLED